MHSHYCSTVVFASKEETLNIGKRQQEILSNYDRPANCRSSQPAYDCEMLVFEGGSERSLEEVPFTRKRISIAS